LGVEPRKYHLNEGSTAFAALAVLAEEFPDLQKGSDGLLEAVRSKVVSTKHTILSVGTKAYASELWKVAGAYCETNGIVEDYLMELGAFQGDKTNFATTHFMLNLSGRSNAVSAIHAVFEKQKYSDSTLIPITNGVYVPHWQSALWHMNGELASLSSKQVWGIKNELRKELIEEVYRLSNMKLDPNVCTLVWTRRIVEYKRPMTLFADMQRLKNIVHNTTCPFQIIFSGKKGGTDPESIRMMEMLHAAASDPMFEGKIVFISDYSLAMAQKFVTGSDVWLNTPIRGVEACGTSGMKAGLNGTLMASVSDGWMDEVKWDGVGWILPNETKDLANSLYDTLEKQILPEFYARNSDDVPESWVGRMRATMNIVASDYSAAKMIQGYEKKLYS
jgi:starch phosphorylase